MNEKILKWEYNSTDKSIIYPIIKANLCIPAGKFIPYYVSPNWITIFGFLFTIIGVALCYFKKDLNIFDKTALAILSFVAFFFDALDGTQGRRWRQDKKDITYSGTQFLRSEDLLAPKY